MRRKKDTLYRTRPKTFSTKNRMHSIRPRPRPKRGQGSSISQRFNRRRRTYESNPWTTSNNWSSSNHASRRLRRLKRIRRISNSNTNSKDQPTFRPRTPNARHLVQPRLQHSPKRSIRNRSLEQPRHDARILILFQRTNATRRRSPRHSNLNTTLNPKHDNNSILHMLRSSRTLRHTITNNVNVSLIKGSPKSSFYFYHSSEFNTPRRYILHLQLQIQKRLRYNIFSAHIRTIKITLPISNMRILSLVIVLRSETNSIRPLNYILWNRINTNIIFHVHIRIKSKMSNMRIINLIVNLIPRSRIKRNPTLRFGNRWRNSIIINIKRS